VYNRWDFTLINTIQIASAIRTIDCVCLQLRNNLEGLHSFVKFQKIYKNTTDKMLNLNKDKHIEGSH